MVRVASTFVAVAVVAGAAQPQPLVLGALTPDPCGHASALAAWSSAQRRRLCAADDQEPAEAVRCAGLLADVLSNRDDLIDLCADAASASAVQECMRSMEGSSWASTELVQLCAGANSSAVGLCARLVTEDTRLSRTQVAKLCAKTSQGAAHTKAACVKQALRLPGFDPAHAVELCRRSGRAAFDCAEAARRGNRALATEQGVDICQGAVSTAPGECASNCGTADSSVCAAVCKKATSSDPGRCAWTAAKANLDQEATIRACQGADSDAPVACLQHNMWQQISAALSMLDRASLCNRVPTSEAMLGRLKCARQAPHQLDPLARISLCNGTTTDTSSASSQSGPSTCLRDVLRTNVPIDMADAHRLCRAHLSYSRSEEHGAGRASCMRTFRQHKPPIEAAIALCRAHETVSAQDVGEAQFQCLAEAAKVDPSLPTSALLELCRHSEDSGPQTCFRQAHKLRLVGSSAPSASAISMCAADALAGMCCIEALQRSFSKPVLAQIADLGAVVCQTPPTQACHGPAECFAEAVAKKLDQDFAVRLCASAKSEYPAECAARLRKNSALADNDISKEDVILSLCSDEESSSLEDLGPDGRDPPFCMESGKPLLKARVFDRPRDRLEELCKRAPYGVDAVECVLAHKSIVGSSRAECNAVIDLCTSVPNGTLAVAECVARAPLASPLRERVCLGSESGAPAVCATVVSAGAPRLDPELIVEACQGVAAQGEAVAQCVLSGIEAKVKRVTKRAVVGLCKPGNDAGDLHSRQTGAQRAHSAAELAEVLGVKPSEVVGLVRLDVAAECARAAVRREFSLDQIGQLCGGANAAPATTCLQGLSTAFSPAQALRLCARSTETRGKRIAKCVQAGVNGGLDSPEAISTLCEDAPSEDTAREMSVCLRLGLEVGVSQTNVAQLCAGTTSDAPVRCFMELQRDAAVTDATQVVSLCRANPREAPHCIVDVFANARDFEKRRLVDFCAVPAAHISAACVASAPLSWSLLDKIMLCRGATSTAPGECASLAASISRMSRGQTIRLCQNATDLRPASCAQTVFPTGGATLAVAICRQPERPRDDPGVESAPEKCAAHALMGRHAMSGGLPRRVIEECRQAVCVPWRLAVLQTRELYELVTSGNVLVGDDLGPLMFQLVDQYGFPVNVTHGPMASGASQQGQEQQQLVVRLRLRRVGAADHLPAENLDAEEAVYTPGNWIEFSSVRVVDVTGDFELGASFASLPHLRSSVLKLAVHRNMDEVLRALLRCTSVPVRLQCAAGASRYPESKIDVHFVSRPWSSWLMARACEAELAELGVETLSSPAPLNRGAYVRLRSGPAKLLSGVGVPTSEMTPEEVLGVRANATSSELRKAYYRASLEWHPDRWVSFHPDLQAQAAQVFERIATANRELQDHIAALADLCEPRAL